MRILSLGGGQQSTAVYLLAATGEIPAIDYAIFADTGEEPKWVYETVTELAKFPGGAPILTRALKSSDGQIVSLSENLLTGNARRFATIPAFVKHLALFGRKGKNIQGMSKRQCTKEFKVSVVEQTIRHELLGLEHGQAYRGPRLTQVFGLDFSEGTRIFRVKGRLANTPLSVGDFPLWDLQWRRSDCITYLADVWGREVLPSACTFCPLVNNDFRRLVRDRDPEGHAKACAVDAALREPGAAAAKMLDGELYIHQKMVPLSEVNLDEPDGLLSFAQDCEGFCGH